MADSRLIQPFVRKWEGGLSRSKSDYASKNPAPCMYQGYNDWHTNKGVTWVAYAAYKKSIGRSSDCIEFFKMDDKLWTAIFEYKYWNPYLLNEYKYQSIANTLFSWGWGSGVAGGFHLMSKYLKSKGFDYYVSSKPNFNEAAADTARYMTKDNLRRMKNDLEALVEKHGEMAIFVELANARETFFRGIGGANLKGWLNRLAEFKIVNQSFFSTLSGDDSKKKIVAIAMLLTVSVGMYMIVKNL